MGNFKHQSLRPNDRDRERDRERDGEKDRERDIRDKEGQERLRHVGVLPSLVSYSNMAHSFQINMIVTGSPSHHQMQE